MVVSLTSWAPLIHHYFLHLQVQSLLLLVPCSSPEERLPLLRNLSLDMISASFAHQLKSPPLGRNGAVLDLSCPQARTLLLQISSRRLFGLGTEWLLLDGSEGEASSLLGQLYLLPGSSVTVAKLNKTGRHVELWDVYRVAEWSPVNYKLLSHQSREDNVTLRARGSRSDFQGVTLRSAVVVLYKEFFVGLGELQHPEADTYTHVIHFLVQNIAQQLNFKYTLLLLYDYGYRRSPEEGGNFTGLMGYLERRELEFGTAGLMMRSERIDAVDFAGNIFPFRSPLLFRQPPLSTVSNIFLLPFSRKVWLCLGSLTGLTLACLLLDHWLSRSAEEGGQLLTGPSDLLITLVAHLSQQGSGLEAGSFAGKSILLLFSVFTFFLFIAYSAKILALLQSTAGSITTLSQLVRSPLTVGVQDVVYNWVYFKESEDREVKELYLKKILPQGASAFLNADQGVQRLRSGLYAFKVETNWAYKRISETYLESEKCGLAELPVFFLPMLSVGLPKGSGHREHISRSMAWERESGLFAKIYSSVFSGRPACTGRTSGYTSVHLRDFQPALYALLFGLALSLVLLLAELLSLLRYRHRWH